MGAFFIVPLICEWRLIGALGEGFRETRDLIGSRTVLMWWLGICANKTKN